MKPTLIDLIQCATREASMRRRVYATGNCTLKPETKARELARQDAIVTLLGWLSEQPEVVARAEAVGIIQPENSTPQLL